MKQIQIAIALTAIALLLVVALLLQPREEVQPITNTEIIYVTDLPKINFNWTPINERTEKPKDIPTLHFNTLER